YTQLGRRAFDKTKEAREAHKLLQDQATGVTPLAPEARAELDERFNAAQQQLKVQQTQLKQLEQQHGWLKELRLLQESQQAATEQLHSAQQQWESLAGERVKLTRLEQLGPQRHQFARKSELDALLTPLAAQIAAHTQQHAELSKQQTLLEQNLAAAKVALSEAQQRQSENA
ncbi:MAG: chromosome segregation protein SMC, partial [Pseudomonas sp.]